MNRDIQIPAESDYVMKLELLGEDNEDYNFNEDDTLILTLNDIKGTNEQNINANIDAFENPLSLSIPLSILEDYSCDPIKYKLVLYKSADNLTVTLLSGNIYRS